MSLLGAAEAAKNISLLGGYDWDIIEEDTTLRHLECGRCHKLARDAVEIVCECHFSQETEHETEGTIFWVYCEGCLNEYLAKNGNKCPINDHSEPQSRPLRRERFTVLGLSVTCPNGQKQTELRGPL